MKLRIWLFVISYFIGVDVFAQTPKNIEEDLLTSLKKINSSQDGNDGYSLDTANDVFAEKLKYYTEKYSSTINQRFTLLENEHLNISTSHNGLLRVYSWDTRSGGTMHVFESVFQYKYNSKTYSILDTPKQEGDIRPFYKRVYQLKINNQTYYLATHISIGPVINYGGGIPDYFGGGIQVFAIKNGKLNDCKLIKTKKGLISDLSFECDLSKWNSLSYPSIRFNESTKTIFIPFIKNNDAATHKYITYKFTGKYFEKVKP